MNQVYLVNSLVNHNYLNLVFSCQFHLLYACSYFCNYFNLPPHYKTSSWLRHCQIHWSSLVVEFIPQKRNNFFFIKRPMTSAPNNNFLSSDQNKLQISYSTIKNFTSWINWNLLLVRPYRDIQIISGVVFIWFDIFIIGGAGGWGQWGLNIIWYLIQ